MKHIWHFSDTHTYHDHLKEPDNIDVAIFSGDCSNPRFSVQNATEVLDFINWYERVQIPVKIFVAGNHDTSIQAGLITREDFTKRGIIYLENESYEVDGITFWGSPYTPEFGNGWAYNMRRDAIHEVWKLIPVETDVLITHGPPKGFLDLAYKLGNPSMQLENCGCQALKTRIFDVKPKYHCFGHIHNNGGNYNAGLFQSHFGTVFSNGSILKDQAFSNGPIFNGNIFSI